jgi:hypothetical protein
MESSKVLKNAARNRRISWKSMLIAASPKAARHNGCHSARSCWQVCDRPSKASRGESRNGRCETELSLLIRLMWPNSSGVSSSLSLTNSTILFLSSTSRQQVNL